MLPSRIFRRRTISLGRGKSQEPQGPQFQRSRFVEHRFSRSGNRHREYKNFVSNCHGNLKVIVISHLPAAEVGTAESPDHAEAPLYRRHLAPRFAGGTPLPPPRARRPRDCRRDASVTTNSAKNPFCEAALIELKMANPRRATTESLSSSSLRLCAFASSSLCLFVPARLGGVCTGNWPRARRPRDCWRDASVTINSAKNPFCEAALIELKMAVPRRATTESLSSSCLRLRAFALPYSSLFPSPAKAGFRPKLRRYSFREKALDSAMPCAVTEDIE